MNDAFNALWQQLRDLLKTRGDLPLRYELLTPAEIAKYIASSSDDMRAQHFVWDYYYPQRYGHIEGTMTDAEAEVLIASFIEKPIAATTLDSENVVASDASAQAANPTRVPCGLCGRRVAESNEA